MELEAGPARNTRRRWLILASLWGVIAAVLLAFRAVVLPFAAAALIAFLVAPLVGRMTRPRLLGRTAPRWVAILALYLGFFGVAYLGVISVVPQLYRELVRVSGEAVELGNSLTPERIQQLARDSEAWLSAHSVPLELTRPEADPPGGRPSRSFGLSVDLEQMAGDFAVRSRALLQQNLGRIVLFSRSLVVGTFAAVFMLLFMLMLAAFITIDAELIGDYGLTLVPLELRPDLGHLMRRIERSLAGVVRGQMTICLINGFLTLVGLFLLKVKFAFLLASLATLLALIPIFGTIVSSVPIVAIALSQGWKTGLAALAWIAGIHALEAYFLNPKIMGSAARIHPLVMAFALIAGERTFGLVGALLAAPVAAIGVACFEFAREKAQA